MAHVICSLLKLDNRQRLFDYGIDILEKSCPKKGIDTGLITELITKSNQLMKQLHLDTKDTTGEELYYSLLALGQQKDAIDILSGYNYVLKIFNNRVVSFNLKDIKANNSQKLSFFKQINQSGIFSLEKELINRYRNNSNLAKSELDEIFKMMGLLTSKK